MELYETSNRREFSHQARNSEFYKCKTLQKNIVSLATKDKKEVSYLEHVEVELGYLSQKAYGGGGDGYGVGRQRRGWRGGAPRGGALV